MKKMKQKYFGEQKAIKVLAATLLLGQSLLGSVPVLAATNLIEKEVTDEGEDINLSMNPSQTITINGVDYTFESKDDWHLTVTLSGNIDNVTNRDFVDAISQFVMGDDHLIRGLTVYNLRELRGHDNTSYFSRFTNLEIFNSPDLEILGSNAFISVSSLKYVDLPNVTAVGIAAFQGADRLTSVYLPNVRTIENIAFARVYNRGSELTSVYMPNVTTIRSAAFMGAVNLTTVDMTNVVTIENSAFNGARGLTSVYMPNLATIGANAFNRASGLTSVNMPNVIYIGNDAFYGVNRLTSLDIGAPENRTVQELINLFNPSNDTLEELTIRNLVEIENTTVGEGSLFRDFTRLTTVAFPQLETIGTNAFLLDSTLTEIDAPRVTRIGDTAFRGVENLINVDFPNATFVGASAFENARNLTSVYLPSVTSVQNLGFAGATELTSVYLPNATLLGIDVFSGASSLMSIDLPSIVNPTNQAFNNSALEVVTTREGRQATLGRLIQDTGILGIVTDAPNLEDLYLEIGDSLSLSNLAIVNDSLDNLRADVSSRWLKNGEEIGTDKNFIVDSVSVSDSGLYQGVLDVNYSNGTSMGSFSTNEVNVNVNFAVDEERETTMYSQFKLGYWRHWGFVLEGTAGLEGVNFATSASVDKTVEIVNGDGEVVESIPAVSVDWFNPSNFNSFQALLTNEMLGSLPKDSFTLQVRLEVDGNEYVSPIEEQFVSSRGWIGDVRGSIADIEIGFSHGNQIQFGNMMGQMVLSVTRTEREWNPLVDRTIEGEIRVIDAWLAVDFDFSQEHTKYFVAKDSDGNEVSRVRSATWNIRDVFGIQVSDDWEHSGVQIFIYPEYQTGQYNFYVEVRDASNEKVSEVEVVLYQEIFL